MLIANGRQSRISKVRHDHQDLACGENGLKKLLMAKALKGQTGVGGGESNETMPTQLHILKILTFADNLTGSGTGKDGKEWGKTLC